jgi:hypothetical protein
MSREATERDDTSYLHEAITELRAPWKPPPAHPDRGAPLSNLGSALRAGYDRDGQPNGTRDVTARDASGADRSDTAAALHDAVRAQRDRHPELPTLWAAHVHAG